MYSHLLKKALPFTLALVVGVFIGGLFKPRAADSPSWASWHGARREFGFGRRRGRDHCRMRRRYLVAETQPLRILFQPEAYLPFGRGAEDFSPARVLVTFGADGKVQAVEPLDDGAVAARRTRHAAWNALESAARSIHFEPETINGMPVSVSKEVEVRFSGD